MASKNAAAFFSTKYSKGNVKVHCDIVYTIAFVTNESMCSTENMEKYPKNIAFAFWYFQGLRKKTLFGSQNGK